MDFKEYSELYHSSIHKNSFNTIKADNVKRGYELWTQYTLGGMSGNVPQKHINIYYEIISNHPRLKAISNSQEYLRCIMNSLETPFSASEMSRLEEAIRWNKESKRKKMYERYESQYGKK